MLPEMRSGRRLVRVIARRTGNEYRLAGARQVFESYSEYRNRLDDAALATVLSSTLKPTSHCIDVGAHDGVILAHMLRIAPRGRHLAFEPLADHAGRLQAAFPTVDVRNLALGDGNGSRQFMRRPDTAYSSLETVPAGEDAETWRGPIHDDAVRTTVEVRRLDDILPDGFEPAVIKIDVEGTEQAVLDGAASTLARYRPVVALEHGIGATHHGFEAGGIHARLTDCGLRIFDADGRGPYSRETLRTMVLSGRTWFFFAFPA